MAFMEMKIKDFKKIKANAEKIGKKGEVVIKRTMNDFKSRGPAWISGAVTKTYNVKKARVKASITGKKVNGKIKVSGKLVDNAQIVYEGRLLTPLPFGMKPTTRPAKAKSGNPYTVTAEVFKGKRKPLGKNVFISPGNGGIYLPFQRRVKDRMPIDAIKTLSVPQMITNEQVSVDIQTNISEGLSKRLEHHIEQEMKKG